MAGWSTVIGIMMLVLAFIASIVLYFVKKKWYFILYLISISFYIFTVLFIIDIYDPSKIVILLLLLMSAFVMIFLGFRLSKSHNEKQEQAP